MKSGIALALAVCIAIGWGCARREAPAFEIGRHRVSLTPPKGWEHVDHGRQHLFRKDVMQVTLADLGPGSAEGLVRAISEARAAWLDGRREDAFERVRELKSPALHFATSDAWTGFWRTWNDVSARRDVADSSEIGAAFDSLAVWARRLPASSRDDVVRFALQTTRDRSRREIAGITDRASNGVVGTVAETWGPVSHANRKRTAVTIDKGDLLMLWTERGPIEQTGPVFDALLASMKLESVALGR